MFAGRRCPRAAVNLHAMCGRYELAAPTDALLDLLEIEPTDLAALGDAREARLEIHPSAEVLIAINEGPRALRSAWWGFASADLKQRPFNARDDKLETAFWRQAFESQRCLIPASAFFEWREVAGSKKKQPVKFALHGGQPFCFAGLWTQAGGHLSCTIITTTPSPLVAPVHDRMPVILPRGAHAAWMQPGRESRSALHRLLTPYPSRLMTAVDLPLAPDPQLTLL
jgi:putative SOS response-associated peptidase YedK